MASRLGERCGHAEPLGRFRWQSFLRILQSADARRKQRGRSSVEADGARTAAGVDGSNAAVVD